MGLVKYDNEQKKCLRENLKKFTEEQGITKTDLADKLGYAYNTVISWFRGTRLPSQFGEEEKRYLVKMKGMSEENTCLTFRFGHTWMLSNFEECEEFRLHHTRKELEEAGFGWVFNCEGIEIEEVEE